LRSAQPKWRAVAGLKTARVKREVGEKDETLPGQIVVRTAASRWQMHFG
jgi:hypothetical protein